MSFFDAHAVQLIIALAMTAAVFVISGGAVPVVVRVVSVVVPRAPSRARRK